MRSVLKTARAIPEAYVVICVACRDVVPEPKTGSHMWLPGQSASRVAHCVCGADMKLPKVLLTKGGES
jgi:hypothetical protein